MVFPGPSSIDPSKLDLVMRDADFVIYYDGKPLCTPGGNEMSHPDSRTLKHIVILLSLGRQTYYNDVNSYSIISFSKDYIEKGKDPIMENFENLIANDPLLNLKFNPDKKNLTLNVQDILENLEEKNRMLTIILLTASIVRKGLNDFFTGLEGYRDYEKDYAGNRDKIISYIRQIYENFSPERKAAVHVLLSAHNSGILLPMMLILLYMSPAEYAVTAIGAHSHPVGPEISDKSLINKEITGIDQVCVDWSTPRTAFSVFHEHAMKVNDFLEFFGSPGKKISVISELIHKGENEKAEFKSTLRWDIRQNKKNPAIEHAALKTITAFLNSEGGDLLLGVADDGTIVGVEPDGFLNDDKFLLHLWMLIKSSMGKDISPFINTTLEKFEGKTVCRVSCKRSPKPVFLRQSGFDEMFYIRIGPSSGTLDISEALKYIGTHFS